MTTVIFEITAEIQMQLTVTLLFTCSWSSLGVDELLLSPCLQSAVYSISELTANSENKQMSTILEINNYLTGFNQGDFI